MCVCVCARVCRCCSQIVNKNAKVYINLKSSMLPMNAIVVAVVVVAVVVVVVAVAVVAFTRVFTARSAVP